MKYVVVELHENSLPVETVFSSEDLLKSKNEATSFFKTKRSNLYSSNVITGKVELGIKADSGEFYSLSGRSQLSASIEAIELLRFAESEFADPSQKKEILSIVKKFFKLPKSLLLKLPFLFKKI